MPYGQARESGRGVNRTDGRTARARELEEDGLGGRFLQVARDSDLVPWGNTQQRSLQDLEGDGRYALRNPNLEADGRYALRNPNLHRNRSRVCGRVLLKRCLLTVWMGLSISRCARTSTHTWSGAASYARTCTPTMFATACLGEKAVCSFPTVCMFPPVCSLSLRDGGEAERQEAKTTERQEAKTTEQGSRSEIQKTAPLERMRRPRKYAQKMQSDVRGVTSCHLRGMTREMQGDVRGVTSCHGRGMTSSKGSFGISCHVRGMISCHVRGVTSSKASFDVELLVWSVSKRYFIVHGGGQGKGRKGAALLTSMWHGRRQEANQLQGEGIHHLVQTDDSDQKSGRAGGEVEMLAASGWLRGAANDREEHGPWQEMDGTHVNGKHVSRNGRHVSRLRGGGGGQEIEDEGEHDSNDYERERLQKLRKNQVCSSEIHK